MRVLPVRSPIVRVVALSAGVLVCGGNLEGSIRYTSSSSIGGVVPVDVPRRSAYS